jgi:hypothetical protein
MCHLEWRADIVRNATKWIPTVKNIIAALEKTAIIIAAVLHYLA